MNHPHDGIDDEIREEMERIAREVIEWRKAAEAGQDPALRWKPRFDTEHFTQDGDKRLVPTSEQVYHDLQLSRGASRPKDLDMEWAFDSPEEAFGKREAVNTERFEHLMRFLPLVAESNILEIGVRNAQFLYYLRQKGFQHLAGIDCVRLNVLWCRKNGFDVQEVDAHELAAHFPPASRDVILAYHVLEHCYDPGQVLAECCAVLKPDGGLQIEVPIGPVDLQTAHCYRFERGELRAMLKSQGFRVVDCLRKKDTERVVAKKAPARRRSFFAWLRNALGQGAHE